VENSALNVHETSALSQTPLSARKGVNTNNAPIGKTSVPNKDVSIFTAKIFY
jgi:hypothetical protein